MQFTTYCLHVLIPQSWSYLHVHRHFTASIFINSSPITNTEGLFVFYRVIVQYIFFLYNFTLNFFIPIIYQIHICFLSLIGLLVLHFLTTFLWQHAPLICNTYTNYYPTSAAFCYPLPQCIIPNSLSLSTSSTISFFFFFTSIVAFKFWLFNHTAFCSYGIPVTTTVQSGLLVSMAFCFLAQSSI